MPWNFFHPPARFVTFLAFSIGGKFLLLSQKQGRFLAKKAFGRCSMQVGVDGEGTNCLVSIRCNNPSPSCRPDWQVCLSFLGGFCLKFCWLFSAPVGDQLLSISITGWCFLLLVWAGGAFCWGSCAGFSTRAPSRSNSLESFSGDTPSFIFVCLLIFRNSKSGLWQPAALQRAERRNNCSQVFCYLLTWGTFFCFTEIFNMMNVCSAQCSQLSHCSIVGLSSFPRFYEQWNEEVISSVSPDNLLVFDVRWRCDDADYGDDDDVKSHRWM